MKVKKNLSKTKKIAQSCLFLTLLQNASCAQEPSQKIIFLDDASKIAEQNRKDVEAFIYTKRASKSAEYGALSGYLPQMKIGGTIASATPDYMTDSCGNYIKKNESTSNRGITFNFSQLLLSGGGPILDYRIAKAGTNIVIAQEQLQKNLVRFGAESSYLDLKKQLLEEDYQLTKDYSAKVVFAKKSEQKGVGLLKNADWLAAAATYAQEQSDIANYQNRLNNAVAKLEREMGIPISWQQIDLSLKKITDFQLEPLDYYLHAASLNRPDLELQEYLIKQARLSEKKYRRSYVPEVSLFATASDQKFGTGMRTSSWYAGLDFGWRFDGAANMHTATQQKNTAIEREMQQKDLELQIQQEVKDAYYNLKNFINQIKAFTVQVKQAKANRIFRNEQFNIGSISASDYAQAEVSYKQAKFNLISSKIGARSSYQQLLFVCGYPKKG